MVNEYIRNKDRSLFRASKSQIYNKEFDCENIRLKGNVYGQLLITQKYLIFRSSEELERPAEYKYGTRDIELKKADVYKQHRLKDITMVLPRNRNHRNCGVEIFFENGKSMFIDLLQNEKQLELCEYLQKINVQKVFTNRVESFKKMQIYEKWFSNNMSNFEYLMWVNILSGRSYHDSSQYFVFPWILKDYSCENLDLNDEDNVYRDLSKPVGALNEDRLKSFKKRQEDFESMGMDDMESFLYGCHYSGPGILTYFLVRLEPFTTMVHNLQKGRFDHPDRMFYNLQDSFNSIMTNTSDVKEISPEFYYSADFLRNISKLDFGKTQKEYQIDDVILPPWAVNCEHFIFKQREALESRYVTENIQNWVDLVFGYKQLEPQAKQFDNQFFYSTYENKIVLEKIKDKEQLDSMLSLIQSYGITPHQLFKEKFKKSRDINQFNVQYFTNYSNETLDKINIKFIFQSNFIVTGYKELKSHIVMIINNEAVLIVDSQNKM